MAEVPNVPGVPPLNSYSSNNTGLLVADAAIVATMFLPPVWGIFFQGAPVILPASIASQLASSALAPFAQVASLLGFPNLLPVFASTLEFDFDQEFSVADYPQELGAFQSYDRVQLPFDLRVRMVCGGPVSQRQAFLNAIFAISGGSPLGSSSLLTSALSSVYSSVAGATGALTSIAGSINGGILSGSMSPPLFDIVTLEGTYSSCSVRRVSFSRRADQGATLIAADIWWVQVRQTSTSSFSNTQIPGVAAPQGAGNVQPFPAASIPTGIY